LVSVSPDQIPALEAERATRGNDPGVLTSLGEAYYAAGRFADAQGALEGALGVDSSNVTATLYLAFTLDTLGQFPAARARYEAVRASRPDGDVERVVSDRVTLLGRKEAVLGARAALAREDSLGSVAPPPNTIAVLPLRYTGSDTALTPLGRGLSQIMVTDLAVVSQLTLVERVSIQALLDELALSGGGRVDSTTAARSGRLLRAGRVIDGTINDAADGALRLDAALVDAGSSGVSGSATASDKLEQLFDMEKSVVLDIVRQMGITLSPAEQARIAERPTRNVLAFLAYSRGLQSQDHGDFGAAARAFGEAQHLDPRFGVARAAALSAAGLSRAADARPADLTPNMDEAGLVAGRARLRETIAHVAPGAGDYADRLGNDQGNASVRKGIQESTNTQGPTAAVAGTTIIITVKRP
jgi:TolB-like protein